MENTVDTCQGDYERRKEEREVYLNRARECAKLTIPTLVPEDNSGAANVFQTPYQSVGAWGVNNLASKLLLSLFPPNAPFFKMQVDDFEVEELQGKGARSTVEKGLDKYARAVMASIEESGDRSRHFEAFKHLIVAGNILLYLPKEGGTRVFTLNQYVVKRDPAGAILEAIIEEELAIATLPDELKALLKTDDNNSTQPGTQKKETVKLYTKFYADGNKIKSYQALGDVRVPNSEGSWPVDKAPVIALRWTAVDGEDYGRSYVEEYFGDLLSLDGLSQSLVEGAAMSSRVIFMVRPGSTTKASDVTKAENGDTISGNPDDVRALQVDKQADLRVAEMQATTITERLSYAFLLNSAVQRNGDRVTAEEVRFMAGELEDALGGVYSILSQEYQLPYVNRVIARLTQKKLLPALPEEIARPTIVTGLEALGRGHDLQKYKLLVDAIAPLGPEVLQNTINLPDFVTRIATSLGIDQAGLVKTPEDMAQVKQEQQQKMMEETMAEMAQSAAPALAKAALDPSAQQPQQEG